MKIRVLSKRKGTGTSADPIRPAIQDDFSGLTWVDYTNLAGSKGAASVGLMFVEINASPANIAAIQANPSYGDVSIIDRDDQSKTVDTAAISTQLQALGVAKATADSAISGAKDAPDAVSKINTYIKSL